MFDFVKRIPDPNLFGLSYEEYLQKKYYKISKVALDILKFEEENNNSEEDIKYREIDNKLNYLANCFENLIGKNEEINEIWLLITNFIDETNIEYLEQYYNTFIQHIISYSVEAKISKEELEKLDNILHHKICDSIKSIFNNYKNIHPVMLINFWFSKRETFLKFMSIGHLTGDSTMIKHIYYSNIKTFNELESLNPYNYFVFIHFFKIQFKNDPKDYKHKNLDFYKEMCLKHVLIAKENGYFKNYYELLEDYYTLNLSKCKNWLFKYFIGYGEKPQNLILPFIGFNLLFSIIFVIFNFNFEFGINLCHATWYDKLFNFIYFNNTTMLTVGYGDIYPLGFVSKLFVFILQILGFTFSSSFVALLLRKLLRF
jgi:hypothetical protein